MLKNLSQPALAHRKKNIWESRITKQNHRFFFENFSIDPLKRAGKTPFLMIIMGIEKNPLSKKNEPATGNYTIKRLY